MASVGAVAFFPLERVCGRGYPSDDGGVMAKGQKRICADRSWLAMPSDVSADDWRAFITSLANTAALRAKEKNRMRYDREGWKEIRQDCLDLLAHNYADNTLPC